jgi:hypothetical protein
MPRIAVRGADLHYEERGTGLEAVVLNAAIAELLDGLR